MNKYLFILGNHPKLSAAEIKSLFNYLNVEASLLSLSTQVLQVNTKDVLDEKIIERLGGTIKIARVCHTDSNLSYSHISKILVERKKSRVVFGISVYNFSFSKGEFIKLCKKIKTDLENHQIRANYCFPQKGGELSSVVVWKKIIKKDGLEFIICKSNDQYILAQTVQIQDFKRFSHLDYGIPCFDPKAGMLPPKLAQMMINLSLPDNYIKSPIIFDPFCGRGRILLQCLINGFEEVFGSDVDKNAIEQTKKNVQWLANEYMLKLSHDFYASNIFVQDATKKVSLAKKPINSIVTEPFLGPAYKNLPSSQEIEKLYLQLEKLYLAAFKNLLSLLTNDSKIVCVFPVINHQSLLVMLVDKISSMGYNNITSFEYARKYQIVKREIGVFKLNYPNRHDVTN